MALTTLLIAVAAACGTAGGRTDQWSRSYLAPPDTVFDNAVEVLEDEGYLVEADRGAGRLVAEPPAAHRGRQVLVLQIEAKGEQVVVDVQVRPGEDPGPMVSQRTDAVVAELLYELDRRMQGNRG
jgi:hypothetical protein